MMRLEKIAEEIAELTIKEIECAKSGHLASSLSCVNIITALYFSEMKHDAKNPYNEERDRFVLSKGHAVPALYSALALSGYFDKKELCSLRRLGSKLQGHPSLKFSREIGIEASTGSLGQGFSIACGIALNAKLEKKKYRTYVLLGDGECDEGIVWESALFASHNCLNNLTAIIDCNGTQMDGKTKDVLSLEPLDKKWESFGWNVLECENRISEIIRAIRESKRSKKPTVIIVRTNPQFILANLNTNNKGKGKKSPLYHLGLGLQHIAKKRDDMVVLTADLKYSTGVEKFAEKFKSKFIECGIAEANMLGTSYGLAVSGKCVFAVTHAIWLTGRAWDIMRTICADGLDVKFIGTHAGLSNGQDGFSHHSTEALASFRS
ncbi:MAG: 1-deoxy-D-xylulose-5-phosphate synthase N-terminal domain-containing protein, partial [Thermoplasmata archaeon]